MNKKLSLLFLLAMILVLPGCIKIKSSKTVQEAQSRGGIYVSVNQGDLWAESSRIATVTNDSPTFAGASVTTIALDPQDHQAMYVGTEANGMFFSYDGGLSWQQFETLSQGPIASIAVHPEDKCTIFVAQQNRILRSEDCSRTWERMYFDTRLGIGIAAIAIDWYDPNIMYAGTTDGDILKSNDSGVSWATVHRAEDEIREIIIAADTRNVIVSTEYNGLFITNNKGASWVHRYDEIRKTGSSDDLTDMVLDFKNNVLIIATKHGLMRSSDLGASWESIPLLAPEGGATIYSIATNPGNYKELYYGTASTFFKSVDGGETWVSSQLPTPSIPQEMMVHSSEHNKIFIGFKRIDQN